MAASLLHLILLATLSVTVAFHSPPCSRRKHRYGFIIRKYGGGHNDDQSIVQNSASTVPDVITANIEMTPEKVVIACMDAMQQNDVPWLNHGLELCFDYSSDRCRAALGGSLDEFISYASNPTFGSMTNTKSYEIVNVGPIIAGTPTRGSMQTVLVKITQEKWEDKHFLWLVNALCYFHSHASFSNLISIHRRTLQQERRPPRQGLWLIHECIYVENAFALTE
jgi:hypothetical protein